MTTGRAWDRISRTRWAVTRRRVLDRDGFRCVRCGIAGRLEVDHRQPLADFPRQNPYDPDGCQTLCRSCHIAKSKREHAARYPVRPEVQAWRDMVSELTDVNPNRSSSS